MVADQRVALQRLFFVVLVILCFSKIHAQTIPPFKMYRSDWTVFSAAELPKGKAVMLIYFDPDCDHCQKLMTEFFKSPGEFSKAEVVMVTFKPVSEVLSFEQLHNMRQYPNIRVGTEGTGFYLRLYYGLTVMPFVALYDKNGKLNASYKKETPLNEILKKFKKIM